MQLNFAENGSRIVATPLVGVLDAPRSRPWAGVRSFKSS